MSKPEISTAEEFRRKAEERREGKGEYITLPSGLKILAYRPGPEWWLRHMGHLPQSMTIQRTGEDSAARTHEDLIKFAGWMQDLIQTVVIAPKVRLNPGQGEIDPNWISDEDMQFITRFAGGEMSADGASLNTFSDGDGTAKNG